MGLLAHRAASDFVQPPKRPLRVHAVYVCLRAASKCELFEKHAFWHKTRDITHFIGFEALLSPEVTALSPRKVRVRAQIPPVLL